MHYERTNHCESTGEYRPMPEYDRDECAPVKEANMTDMQKKATGMAEEILLTVRRLSDHMIGYCQQEAMEKPGIPDCFRNDIFLEVQILREVLAELQHLSKEIGV